MPRSIDFGRGFFIDLCVGSVNRLGIVAPALLPRVSVYRYSAVRSGDLRLDKAVSEIVNRASQGIESSKNRFPNFHLYICKSITCYDFL